MSISATEYEITVSTTDESLINQTLTLVLFVGLADYPAIQEYSTTVAVTIGCPTNGYSAIAAATAMDPVDLTYDISSMETSSYALGGYTV